MKILNTHTGEEREDSRDHGMSIRSLRYLLRVELESKNDYTIKEHARSSPDSWGGRGGGGNYSVNVRSAKTRAQHDDANAIACFS